MNSHQLRSLKNNYFETYILGVDVILRLLHFGALKSLKTGLGETALDIGVRRGRSSDILDLLELPQTVVTNKKAIKNIEKTVHKIIEERVGDKLKETGEQLPQLSILWEMSNECGNLFKKSANNIDL